MGRKTKDEAAKTRESILEAAVEVFIEKGVSRTSLQDIAKTCGVTRGAVYHHFENKSALLWELLESVRLPLDAIWSGIAQSGSEDPLATLKACLVKTFDHLVNDQHAIRIHKLLLYRCEYNEELQPVLDDESKRVNDILVSIQGLLQQAAERNLLKPGVSVEDGAKALFCLSTGLYKNFIKHNWGTEVMKTIRFSIDTLMDGMRR